MKSKVDAARKQGPAANVGRASTRQSAGAAPSGPLTQLATAINSSPRMQAQLKLVAEMQNGGEAGLETAPSHGSRQPSGFEQAPVQREADAEAGSGHWIVAAGHKEGTLQIGKEHFLSLLRERVTGIAEAALAKLGMTASSCPYIPYWFHYYAGKDAAHIEAAILRYAPEAASAASWQGLLDAAAERVRQGFEQHVKTGSLEGVPEELPQDLHEDTVQRQTKPADVAQRCCGGEEPERTHLISNTDSMVTISTYDHTEKQSPKPETIVDLRTWTRDAQTANIFGTYPVYYQVEAPHYRVIAVNVLAPNRGKVVANSYLTTTGKKHKDPTKVYFTDFGSDPPFSGLGTNVIRLLENRTGQIAVPSGPIPGAYSAYKLMGDRGFQGMGGFNTEAIDKSVKLHTDEAKRIKSEPNFSIENPDDRERLQQVQEKIKKLELMAISTSKVTYHEPD